MNTWLTVVYIKKTQIGLHYFIKSKIIYNFYIYILQPNI